MTAQPPILFGKGAQPAIVHAAAATASAPTSSAPASTAADSAVEPLGMISRVLRCTLESLRAAADGDAVVGLAGWVIHHVVETLRRSGQIDAARKILAAELSDLALTHPRAPQLVVSNLTTVKSGGPQS